MNRTTVTIALILGAALFVPAARAQNGCVNSPENPTAVLALVGAGGAALSAFRARRRR